MKHIKTYNIFETKLSFDTNDIDDILIDLVEAGYFYNVELDWYNGEPDNSGMAQSVRVTIWKKNTNITQIDIESIREDLHRLVKFMSLNGYGSFSTYPLRLLRNTFVERPRRFAQQNQLDKLADKASGSVIDKIEIKFNSN